MHPQNFSSKSTSAPLLRQNVREVPSGRALVSSVLPSNRRCIDQGSTQEKGIQVPLMTSIYSQAQRVVVWLGHEDLDTDSGTNVVFKMLMELSAELISAAKEGLLSGRSEPSQQHLISHYLSPSSNPE